MTVEFVTTATVKAGRLSVRRWDRVDAFCRGQKDGTEFVVRIEKKVANRSDMANRYYWGTVIHMISEFTGHTPNELHDHFTIEFLPKRLTFVDANGVVDEKVIGGRTSVLSVGDFYCYVEQVRQAAAEHLSLAIPDPEGNYNQRPVRHDA